MREKVSSAIIDKAVDLWCKKLMDPVFDNGDKSDHGFLSMALATINIETAKTKIQNMAERIEVFKTALRDELLRVRDNPKDGEYFSPWLDVDYHPCQLLADAAEKAGIPKSQFSCKSSVAMFSDCVQVSFGYAATHIYYYPLPDGRWLITSLRGKDITKIIDSVISLGNPLNFLVEG